MQKLHFQVSFYALLLALSPLTAGAQNTIGGVKKEVPEAEVARQSAFLEAESQRMLGKHENAVAAYQKFLYDNPKNDAAWYGLSRSYAALQDAGNALSAIGKALEIDPQNEWYYLQQADLFEQTGRARDAVKVYESLTKRFPERPAFWERLAYLSVLANDPQSGIKALDKLEKLTGVTEASATKKHLIYVGLNDNRRAAAELARLADAYPAQLDYRHQLAKFYLEIGDKDAAKATYQDILRRRPDDSVAQLAVLEKNKNSGDAAYLQSLLPVFQDPAVNLDAKVKQVLPYLPKLEKGDDASLTTALLELATAVEKAHPDEPKAWSLSADLWYLANRPAEALTRYKKCISLKPKAFSVWDNALSILADQQQAAEMLPLAEQAMDAFPNQPKAYYWYAVSANLLGRPDDALAQIEQANLMAAGNPALRLDLADQAGVALLAKRDAAAAVTRFEQALSLPNAASHPALQEHYGDALAARGDRSKALEAWKKAYALRKSPALEQKIGGQ